MDKWEIRFKVEPILKVIGFLFCFGFVAFLSSVASTKYPEITGFIKYTEGAMGMYILIQFFPRIAK